MDPTPQEIAWLLLWLEKHQKGMPGGRSQRPHYDATRADLDDLFRGFRSDAVYARDIVWQAVSEYAKVGVWPKMKPPNSYWLRQRWLMALRYCRAKLEKEGRSDPSPIVATRPADVEASTKWLLLDLWEERLVDVWIRENARDCVFIDWPEDDPEYDEERDLEKYFEKLECR